ncbi:hypothetical protein [Pseudoxanthomonas sp. UTMC 1351]|uniref:hypothetical protein n=1 Tax=Pseudoxanthomonas sp. UTMC 1351 TaxID=2695853 RepID=UPI0034D010FD
MMRPIVVSGDTLKFDAMFGNRQVTATAPARIVGKGHASIGGKKICIAGDEGKVQISADYVIPSGPTYANGKGTITIAALNSDQLANEVTSGQALIIDGTQFEALFTPTVPAISPGVPPRPDPAFPSPSKGAGQFIATQSFAKARSS